MKARKLLALFLSAAMMMSMAACGRKQDNTPTTMPTTQPTEMTILPNIDPTLDTNIPDPNINTEIPTYTDGTDPSGDMRSGMMN
mgnify:CR=1 FL=1